MRTGGVAIFHEYAHYLTWRFVPLLPNSGTIRARGQSELEGRRRKSRYWPGPANYLAQNGFVLLLTLPRIYCVGPSDYMWQWPGNLCPDWIGPAARVGVQSMPLLLKSVRHEVAEAGKNPNALMITPLVLEIVAEKVS